MSKSALIQIKTWPRTIRGPCAALIVIGLFIVSFFATGTPGARALLGFVPIVALMCAVEFHADAGQRLLRRERWRIRPAQMNRARLLRSILLILLHAFIFCAALFALLRMGNPKNIPTEFLRSLAGVTLLYAVAVVLFELCSLLFLAAGHSLPLMHHTPVAARSVGEFWGRRWNIGVSAWLSTFIFRPIARRRYASLGILCAFLVSGLFHGWPILLALGAWPAFMTVVFFVIQGVMILAEGHWHIHTWPVPLARAWTVIILLAPAPLFINPGLRLFGL